MPPDYVGMVAASLQRAKRQHILAFIKMGTTMSASTIYSVVGSNSTTKETKEWHGEKTYTFPVTKHHWKT
jgi:hypothetical protein